MIVLSGTAITRRNDVLSICHCRILSIFCFYLFVDIIFRLIFIIAVSHIISYFFFALFLI